MRASCLGEAPHVDVKPGISIYPDVSSRVCPPSLYAGLDFPLAMTVYTGTTVQSYFYLTDKQGFVRGVVDESGNVVEQYRLDAWGKVLGVYDGQSKPLDKSAIGNRLLWQGREYSWSTGLYYFRTRWYDPTVGRFLSNDKIGIAGGLNMYAYCNDNPVNFRDPFGLDAFDDTANFMAGAGDVLSFGVTRRIRDANADFYMQDYSSGSYKGGEWTGMGYSLALGGGRLAYAGAAKGGSMLLLREGATAQNALKALSMRNRLKTIFNLGALTKDELKTAAWMEGKYGTDWAKWISAAGRTSTESGLFGISGSWNALGAYLFGAGSKGLYDNLTDKKSGCQ